MIETRTSDRLLRFAPLLAGMCAAIVYFFTLAPSIDKIDAGELAAAQVTGGVAHPTGYPLFTLLGFLFSKIPLFASEIYQLNFLALLYVATAVFFFTWAMIRMLASLKVAAPVSSKSKSDKKAKSIPFTAASLLQSKQVLIAGFFAGLWLAFSKTIWEQSTSTEVYSLHALLIALIFFASMNAWMNPSEKKSWVFLALAFGLGMSNHLTTFLFIPSIGILYFSLRGFSTQSLKFAGLIALMAFGTWALLMLWLPIRSSGDAALNWENIHGWREFWFHVLGKQFRQQLFAGGDVPGTNFSNFFSGLPNEFVFLGLVPAIAGAVKMFQWNKILAWYLVLIFTCTVLFVINYDIKDLSPYFLGAYFVIGAWIATGIAWGLKQFSSGSQNLAIAVICLAGVGTEAGINFSKNNKSALYFFEDYPRAAFASLPENSIVITSQWDWFVSASYYLQQVENLRPDITVIDYSMLRNRGWYFNHIRRNYPEVYKSLQPEIDLFTRQVAPFHYREEFNPVELGQSFARLWFKVTDDSLMKRPVYLGPEIYYMFMQGNPQTGSGPEVELPPHLTLLPEYYFFRVVSKQAFEKYIPLPAAPPAIRMEGLVEDYYLKTIKNNICQLAYGRVQYEKQLGHEAEARAAIKRIKDTSPEFPLPAGF